MPNIPKPKDIPAILRKREITPAEKRLIHTTMAHLGVGNSKKKGTLVLPKKGNKK